MPSSRALVRDNPWWADAGAIREDVHLRRLAERALVFDHPIPFELGSDAVYTLRGPRQVGKTTLLKRVVRTLLKERGAAARRICYLDVGAAGVASAHELQEMLTAYLVDVGEGRGGAAGDGDRVHLLIDEVTGIEDWGVVVRALHGRGLLEGVTAVATGSHALDVRWGGERAPGRRGAVEDLDWVMMPLSFRDYLGQRAPELLDSLPPIESLDPGHVFGVAREIELRGDRVSALFERYLLTGGFPHPTEAEHTKGRIPAHVYRLHQDAIRGEMARAGYRERYFRELVSWLGHRRLGREFSWRDASAETEIGSKDTVRRYLEDAEGLFIWHVFYRVKDPARPEEALRSPKKLYPADPFGWHVLATWAAGDPDPWAAALDATADPETRSDLVEAVVADHLRRAFGHFAFYYRQSRGQREIDFVVFPEPGRPRLLEVKQQARIRARHRRELAREGGGLLISRDSLAYHEDDDVAVVPAWAFLAGFACPATLYPAP